MKKVILFLLTLSLCLTACGTKPSTEPQPEQAVSTVSKEHCFLCGDGAKDLPYWGQNNVGIISLNTFEIMPITLNPYDMQGAPIEKSAGYISNCGFQSEQGGFSVAMFADTDRGLAGGTMKLREDAALDTEKAAARLCQTCLDSVLPIHTDQCFGAGLIHFTEREIDLFQETVTGQYFHDFYIHCNWNEETPGAASIQVFYCPQRWPKSP